MKKKNDERTFLYATVYLSSTKDGWIWNASPRPEQKITGDGIFYHNRKDAEEAAKSVCGEIVWYSPDKRRGGKRKGRYGPPDARERLIRESKQDHD